MTGVSSRLCDVCGVVVPGTFRYCPHCSSVIRIEPSEAERLRVALHGALGRQYEIHERIGRGGFGIVYRATDRALGREVAIKALRGDLPDAEIARARFLRGARALAHLEHPHIVPVYDVGESGQLAYVVMPMVAGENLAAILLREGRPPVREAMRVLAEVAEALEYVHEAGLVHRDVKPQHIMLVGRERRAQLIDFTHAGPPGGTAVLGTPAYMSPEMTEGRGRVDTRSDLYSLGVVGYQLLTGELPFEGTAEQQMEAHRSRLTRNPSVHHQDIPLDLAEVVMRCLAKLPQHRWPSAQELLAALHRCGEASQSPAVPPAVQPASPTAPAPPSAPPPAPTRRGAPAARPARASRTPPTRPPRFRNAPLWLALAILTLVGYCALR